MLEIDNLSAISAYFCRNLQFFHSRRKDDGNYNLDQKWFPLLIFEEIGILIDYFAAKIIVQKIAWDNQQIVILSFEMDGYVLCM